MTPTRKNEDTARRKAKAVNPSPILSTSALMQLSSHGHDMNVQFFEGLSYEKKSQSMQLFTGKTTVPAIPFDSPVKHHLQSRAISGREKKSTSREVVLVTDTSEQRQNYELRIS